MLLIATALSLLIDAFLACRIDNSFHGVFKRQLQSNRNLVFDSTFTDPIVYDEITISTTSISEYGDCYEKIGQSYVFGLKRMGRPVCYRCVTPILRAANVLQLAHQQGENCFETVNAAKSSCFDATQVSLSDGTTVFKANAEPAACHVDGRFALEYILKGAELNCAADSGSEMENCQSSSALTVKFRNCTFPDFDMSLKCVGSFRGANGSQYIIVENEESEEYRCGMLVTSDQIITVFFAKDSQCALLNENSAFDIYKLQPVQTERVTTPCQFPKWIRGEYDSLTVTADWLQYAQVGQGTVAVLSRCVHIMDDRVLVYSETKCGEPLGYHCLWFSPRSQSLIEFKTTAPQEDANSTACSADDEFSQWPWTAAVINNAVPSPCGILGKFTTPRDLRTQDCYNVSVDCEDRSALKITASHCSTEVIFDSRQYQCIASWKDEKSLYMFAIRGQETHACFVAEYSSGRLYLASTGNHCIRNFNFSENAEKTIVLEEEAGCAPVQKPPKSPARKPAGPVMKSSSTMEVGTSLVDVDAPSFPISKATVEGQQWTSDSNGSEATLCNAVSCAIVLVCTAFLS